jgi:hypothetical protein
MPIGTTWRFTRDEAGKLRLLANPRFGRAMGRAAGDYRERLLAARGELAPGWWLVLVIFVVAVCAALAAWGEPVGWWLLWPVGLGLVAVALSYPMGGGITDDAIRRVTLAHDLCPSCAGDLAASEVDPATGRVRCAGCGGEWVRPGTRRAVCGRCRYNLYGVAPGEDGVTRCPECGAGWRFGESTTEPRRG